MSIFAIIEGNLTADATPRYTPNGKLVHEVNVAANARKKDQSGNWVDDGEPFFVRVSLWGEEYEGIADQLVKGTPVVVQGTLTNQSYTTKTGETRQSIEVRWPKVAIQVRKGQGRTSYQAPAGGTPGDPWSTTEAPF